MTLWQRFAILVLIPTFIYLAHSGNVSGENAPIQAPLKQPPATPKAGKASIDFEAYRRSIDDIYKVSLMNGPGEFGLNNIIVDLNRTINENPKNSEALISLGHVYRILGQPAEANRFYEKALAVDPHNFHLNVFSAITNVQKKDFEKALAELEHAIDLNPADHYAWLARGRILMILGREGEAVQNFEKVLELQPSNRQAAIALSLLHQTMGSSEKAHEILNQLKEQDPKDPFVRYHLGALFAAEKKTDEAVKHWEELYHEGVRDVQFLFNLAVAYLENGQAVKAGKILEHLNFLFPREADVELLLAESYRQMNLLDEAERSYRLVLAENPNYLSVYMGLAHVLNLRGKFEERKKVLKQGARIAYKAKMKERENQLNAEFQRQLAENLTP